MGARNKECIYKSRFRFRVVTTLRSINYVLSFHPRLSLLPSHSISISGCCIIDWEYVLTRERSSMEYMGRGTYAKKRKKKE